LIGAHQAQNAVTAYCTLELLREVGYTIRDGDIRHGFASVFWPGRFEILQKDPLVVIDSAHNLDSAEKLAETVQEYLPGKTVVLLFGASEDKDVSGMFAALAPVINKIVVTQSVHPRSYDANSLGIVAANFGLPVEIIPQLETALEQAMVNLPADSMLLITGSIFIAAGARQYWLEKKAAG